ncbi:hypothetical protein R8Z50_01675 [Longispora sp. K20-0274]|uniref:hypothetical protein n=1 Tax=Longispora sp. K20-0274 TaxID=3088255 RepID=UPI00399C0039
MGRKRPPKAVTEAVEAVAERATGKFAKMVGDDVLRSAAKEGDEAAEAAAKKAAEQTGVKVTKAGQRKLGNLGEYKDMTAADAIKARGGGQGQVNVLGGDYANKTVGELANLAAQGDETAETAMKIIKQARAKAAKYGRGN